MPVINVEDAHNHLCPWNSFSPCFGERCMAWSRHGRGEEIVKTDNLIETDEGVRPGDFAPPSPEGDGWEKSGPETPKSYHRRSKLGGPYGREQTWVRAVKVTQGHCSRAGHGYCGASF